MKSLISALAFAACVAATPAGAADAGQSPSGDDTYAPMFAYVQANPHARQVPSAVEQAAETKAAETDRAELAAWSSVMGHGDIPQEYLDKAHN